MCLRSWGREKEPGDKRRQPDLEPEYWNLLPWDEEMPCLCEAEGKG